MRSRALAIALVILALSTGHDAFALLNPASVYCDALGYESLSSEDAEGGEIAACGLPNGQVVDAWQFLLGNVETDYSYCARQGLELRTVQSDEICLVFLTDSCAVCVQPDGSQVEVTALMKLRFDESSCGDGTCGFPEDFESCPQDCDEENRTRPRDEQTTPGPDEANEADERPVADLQRVGAERSAEVVVPVLMYYLDRYFSQASQSSRTSQTPGRTPLDTTVAGILDAASPEGRSLLQRALQGYQALPPATRSQRFDTQVVQLTESRSQTLDLSQVRQRLAQLEPALVSPPSGPPAAPSGLVAVNASKLPDPDISGSGKHQIRLSWQTGSTGEDGFVVHRSAKLSGSGSPPAGSFKPLSSVGRGVTQFVDTLSKPGQKTDRYCYRVTAYRSAPFQLVGQPASRLESSPSNIACSDYAVALAAQAVDTDQDGIPDSSDQCPYVHAGFALWTQGCPDVDQDGVANKDDSCPQDWGDDPIPGDKGPTPSAGCPWKFSLRWMRMEVLNNTGPYAYSGFQFLHDGDAIYNETLHDCPGMNKGADCSGYAGEEPYLIFAFANGQDQGAPIVYSTRWCCGERVDVKAGQFVEPDKDTAFEENPLAINDLLAHGLTVFPGISTTKADVIDRKLGLSMSATLMERDFSLAITPANSVDAMGEVFGLGVAVVGAVSGCAGTGGLGCLMSIGGAMKKVIETIFGLSQGESKPVHVNDPDDLMGSGVWAITRKQAQAKTSDDGAYGFWFPVPSDYLSSCMGVIPCTTSATIPVTMRAKLYFCLHRDGVPESKLAQVCAPYTQVLPWPMKP